MLPGARETCETGDFDEQDRALLLMLVTLSTPYLVDVFTQGACDERNQRDHQTGS